MRYIDIPDWDDNADKNPLLANIPAGQRKVIAEVLKIVKMVSDSSIGKDSWSDTRSYEKLKISPVFARNNFEPGWPNAFHIDIADGSIECSVIDVKNAHESMKSKISMKMRQLTGYKNKTEPDSGYMIQAFVRPKPGSFLKSSEMLLDIMNNKCRLELENAIRGCIYAKNQKIKEQNQARKQVNVFKSYFGL